MLAGIKLIFATLGGIAIALGSGIAAPAINRGLRGDDVFQRYLSESDGGRIGLDSQAKTGCRMTKNYQKVLHELQSMKGIDYVAINCREAGPMSHPAFERGIGFFPSNVFKEKGNPGGQGHTFNIYTLNEYKEDGTISEENYRTLFRGESFSEEFLVGTGGKEKKIVDGKELTVVKWTKEMNQYDPCYILFLPRPELNLDLEGWTN